MDTDRDTLQETYRLARDNNRMLHAMRRNAFWGGLFKVVLYALLFLGPLWFYMTYLNDTVQQMLKTVEQIQGTSAKAQTQIVGFVETWKQFESKLPAFMRASTSDKPQ